MLLSRINQFGILRRSFVRFQSVMAESTSAAEFDKKVAIITGSSSGIGLQTALLLAKRGANVVLHGNCEKGRKDTTELFEKEFGADRFHFVFGEFDDEAVRQKIVDEAIKKFGQLDILVNNVGATSLQGQPDYFSMESLRYILEINVVGTADMTQKAIPHLAKTKGNVVMTGATMAVRPSFLGQWYSVSKAALDQYVKVAACTYAPAGIRVNGVRAGAVMTNIYAKHNLPYITDAFLKQVSYHSLQNRVGEPSEIAEVICFLANNRKASFVTGVLFAADGGLSTGYITHPDNVEEILQKSNLGYQSHGLMPKP